MEINIERQVRYWESGAMEDLEVAELLIEKNTHEPSFTNGDERNISPECNLRGSAFFFCVNLRETTGLSEKKDIYMVYSSAIWF